MIRRRFLQLVGVAAASKPSSVADLRPQDIPTNVAPPAVRMDQKSWFKDQYDVLVGQPKDQVDFEETTFEIYALEPDYAALRSMNMQTKLKLSRRQAYHRSRRIRKHSLPFFFKGLWR